MSVQTAQTGTLHTSALLLYIIVIAISYSPVIFAGKTLSPASIQPHGIIDGAYGSTVNEKESTLNFQKKRLPINSFNVDMATPAYYEWPVNRTIGNIYRGGELPLWNPYQGGGTPLLADYSTRALFPYQILEDICPASFADLFLLGRPLITAFFTYLFLSIAGLSFIPAFFGGLLYMLSGVFSWFLTLEQFTNVAMALPLLLFSIELLLQKRDLYYVAFTAITFALVVLAGQPEAALYALSLGALYFLFQSIQLYNKKPKLLAGLLLKAIVAAVVGLMLSAPLTLPFLEFVKESFNLHPPGAGVGLQHAANWRMLLSALVPGATLIPADPSITPEALVKVEGVAGGFYRVFATKGLWDWLGGSVGVILPLLSLTGLLITLKSFIKKRSIRLGATIIFFLAFAATIVLKNFGVRPFLWLGHLPFFDQAWSPRWSGAAWVFALCSASAIGLQLLTSSPDVLPRRSTDSSPDKNRACETKTFANRTCFIFAFLATLSVLVLAALPSVLRLISNKERLFDPVIVPYITSAIGLSHAVTILLLFIALLIVIKNRRGISSGKKTAALLSAVAALELWWAMPRGYGPDGLLLQLIPLAIGLCGILLSLIFKRGTLLIAATAISLFFAGTLFTDSISQNGLRNRQAEFITPPYVNFIQAQPGYPRVMGFYGLLFPNYAGSAGLFDLHYVNALALKSLPEFRYRFLESPIEGQDTTSPSLWFTGMPQRITVKRDNSAIGAHFKIVKSDIERDLLDHLPDYSLMGVKYFLLPKGYKLSKKYAEKFALEKIGLVYDAEIKIFENIGAFDRAFILHPFKDKAAFEATRSSITTNAATGLTIGTDILKKIQNAKAAKRESGIITPATITRYKANSLTIKADSLKPGILIVTDAFAPGWRASVDNVNRPILRINGFVRGLFLDSGPHTIKLTYHAPGFNTGVKLFFAGLGIIALLFVIKLTGRRGNRHII